MTALYYVNRYAENRSETILLIKQTKTNRSLRHDSGNQQAKDTYLFG
jgi:hypothetical protein